MKYLLDTCVISEVIKKHPNEKVISWLRNHDESSMYLSVLTFGEIQKGIEKAPNKNRRKKLILWLEDDLKNRFQNRVIPLDLRVSLNWGTLQGKAEKIGKPMPALDGLIAVTGYTHKCIVVTRNTSDMEQSKAELFNPWKTD